MRRQKKYFNDPKPGMTHSFRRIFTKEDIHTFSRLTGDLNPIHMDKSFAKDTAFKKNIVHGMLVASAVSKLIGMELFHGGVLWMEQNFKFLNPVFLGDDLNFTIQILRFSKSTNTAKVSIQVKNQYNNKVLHGEGVIMLINKINKKKTENKYRFALITGASRGIGRAIALRLARDGLTVGINYLLDEKGASEAAATIKKKGGLVKTFKADVRESSEVELLFSQFDKYFGSYPDLLIYSAGINLANKKIEDLEWQDFQTHLDTQLKGSFLCCKAVIGRMINKGYGKIIFINSIYSWGVPPSGLAHYVSAKTALSGLAKSLALELGPKGITVNSVSPGMTETELLANIPDTIKKIAAAENPLRRIAQPDDIAGVVSFLSGPDSAYLNGADIPVCGGSVMR